MPKRVLKGRVISDKCDKTIVVKVVRKFRHPIYKKTLQRSKNYHAHDEQSKFKTGDFVSIIESRPHSKTKTFEVIYN